MAAPLVFTPSAVLADPLTRYDDATPGAESWWSPPGSDLAPCCDYVEVELGYGHTTLAREKEDSELQSLLMQRGPALRIAQASQSWFSEFKLRTQDVEAARSGTFGLNRLDGSRDQLEAHLGRRFKLGAGELTVAALWKQGELGTNGDLPSLQRGIPGFEANTSAGLDWNENSAGGGIGYAWDDSALMLHYARSSVDSALTGVAPADSVRVTNVMDGESWGITASTGRATCTPVDYFYLQSSLDGDGRFLRGTANTDLGPLESSYAAKRYGLRVRPSFSTELQLVHGDYDFALSGSADISGFGDEVFGLLTPRGHLESSAELTVNTLLLSDRGKQRLGWQVGVSQFDLRANALTYGTALFGSVRIAEQENLVHRRGWLGHLGLNAKWEVGDNSELRFCGTQTLPISVTDPLDAGGPTVPGPVTTSKADGGRTLSLSYVMRF